MSTKLDNSVGIRPRRRRDAVARALLDQAWDVQDDVLDAQSEWLASLPVSDELREEIFKQLCVATGQLVDGLFATRQSSLRKLA